MTSPDYQASGSSYLLDEDESSVDMREVHDGAGSTDQFIAEGLHTIASTAYKHTLVRE